MRPISGGQPSNGKEEENETQNVSPAADPPASFVQVEVARQAPLNSSNAHRISLVKCAEPIVMHGRAFPCGRCPACLLNRKRIWAHRIELEASMHKDNTFLTLTYDDANLPLLDTARATLIPEHLRDFLKRLRKKHAPNRLRFFGVGEYGEREFRPHYHLALFSFPNCLRGQTGLGKYGSAANWRRCCDVCVMVGETWGKGNVYLGTLEPDSCQYVAGYVTKKMTNRQDPRLKGREPEFARMSNRPGIAADFMWDSASAHLQFNLEHREADVPVALRHGSRQKPLGRYLRKKYRTYIGKDEKTPQAILDQLSEELRPLQEAAFNQSKPFAQQLKEAQAQSLLNLEARNKLRKRNETL